MSHLRFLSWRRGCLRIVVLAGLGFLGLAQPGLAADPQKPKLDFNRDIRPILSENCVSCHGPDAKNRKGSSKGGLRLDLQDSAMADLGGHAAIVPGKPDDSELVARVVSDDPDEVMPPPVTGKKLKPAEIETLKTWIAQGAPYAKHWSYLKPVKAAQPVVKRGDWPRTALDRFVLARLEKEGLSPSPEADRYTLIRRLALDLTGLPPTVAEADAFVHDPDPQAYEKLVDRLLAQPSYGEHWARMWLDLARYADSAGYADDPPRTIWAYRDYVIRAFNANMPFDRFTTEQIAGDLLPNPTEDQLIATAFHRNTLTNNEGGTNDEEFRNVAVVDRVNTTMAVWMGTTIACAQCHDHKYDPLSQREYFQLFAFFNNTADADRRDESPLISLYSDEQKRKRAQLSEEIAQVEDSLKKPPASFSDGQSEWESRIREEVRWSPLKPEALRTQSGAKIEENAGLISVAGKAATDTYTLEFLSKEPRQIRAIRLETVPDRALPGGGAGYGGGNFVLTSLGAAVKPATDQPVLGRFVRIEVPGKEKILSLAEVQVFSAGENRAKGASASQSSTDFDGPAALAIDGKTDGRYVEAKSTTHTRISDDPWWEVDLKGDIAVDRVVVWNRTDQGVQTRLSNFRVLVLDRDRKVVFEKRVETAPKPSASFSLNRNRETALTGAWADYSQPGFDAADVLKGKPAAREGWAVGGQIDRPHTLSLVPSEPIELKPGDRLLLTLGQTSKHPNHTLGRFRVTVSEAPQVGEQLRVPESIRTLVRLERAKRTDAEQSKIASFYVAEVSPQATATRTKLERIKKELSSITPMTTVPVAKELAGNELRMTRIHNRGNFEDLGAEVSARVPAVFHRLEAGEKPSRLDLARWLVSPENPLTPRVVVNRYWEQIFGIGLVSTSEEFGGQGELPSHPELLDWLAADLVARGWDLKQLLRELVLSSTYRQDSRAAAASFQQDPENRLLSRGPRFRSSAEIIRDQSLAIAGLLSPKQGGPPTKPPQPASGLTAAFGSMIDWETSKGDERYRRALYTTWRRSNPYPSMAAFDAPSRELCTLRRTRTNTPLQALVTLNDPVYVEAAQALARRIVAVGGTIEHRATEGFRRCVVRPPSERELRRITELYKTALLIFQRDQPSASKLATDPLGPVPSGVDPAELAAWTVVSNVLMNLDEALMKR